MCVMQGICGGGSGPYIPQGTGLVLVCAYCCGAASACQLMLDLGSLRPIIALIVNHYFFILLQGDLCLHCCFDKQFHG
jgi:hypothetical protein